MHPLGNQKIAPRNESLETLQEIGHDPSEAGFRASWLLTLAYLETNQLTRAQEILAAHKHLHLSTTGIELDARIHHATGSRKRCEELYRSVLELSVEAKLYFARQAFRKQDWKLARSLTEEAIALAPNVATLHENLRQIDATAMLQAQ